MPITGLLFVLSRQLRGRLFAFGLYGHTLAALLIDLFVIHEGGLAD